MLMVKTKARAIKRKPQELDSVYLLKMVIYLVLGAFWIRLSRSGSNWEVPLPFGFIIGLFLAAKERFQIDRKLEYAILLMTMFLGFWLPIGLTFRF